MKDVMLGANSRFPYSITVLGQSKNLQKFCYSKIRIFLVIQIIVLVFLFSSQTTNAQNVSLSMTPPLIEATIKPGKSFLVAYTISNHNDPIILTSKVLPFSPSGINGNLALEKEFSGPIRFNLDNADIRLGESFYLTSNEGQQLLLKMRVPEGTPEGDYYYSFIVSTESGKRVEGENVQQATATIGSNILISVTSTGTLEVNGLIDAFEVIPQYSLSLFGKKFFLFESTNIIPVRLIAKNQGRNIVKPQGTITVKGNFGERATFNVLPQNILSNSSRLLKATPSAELNNMSSTINLEGFFVGKYSLLASLSFGEDTSRLSTRIVFYAFPFKLILATLIALTIVVILVKNIGKD